MDEQEKLIHNEQVKLWATFANNSGVACIAGGAFGVVWQAAATSAPFDASKIVVELAAFAFGIGLHFLGRSHLKNLL
jgi:hypothetical protein